ncbi:Berberine bridge enzyme-like [Thalictrum thalictroides]|uniref:Berberine bridge enzyme-like n=1 Tax=Thalictrum thalictroides TaxID=46969 RepID=A0A7J6W025_THATH|nr:Berberine bridge enzyme-like [Thalictrum thalictroides]
MQLEWNLLKVKLFMWCLLLGRVPTGHRLKEEGIIDVNGCPMCDQGRILISIYSYRAAGWWSFVGSYLFLFRSVLEIILYNICGDAKKGTAWVQAGGTIGQLYLYNAAKCRTYSFPAGVCPTVEIGGHFSGGGYGALLRKYDLAADHIIDAQIVNVDAWKNS